MEDQLTVRYFRQNRNNPEVNQTPEYLAAKEKFFQSLKSSKIIPKIDYKIPDSFKKLLIEDSGVFSEIKLNLLPISKIFEEIHRTIDLSNLNINTKIDLSCRIFLPLEPLRNGFLEEQILSNIKYQLKEELEIFNSVNIVFEYQNSEYTINLDNNEKSRNSYRMTISEKVIEFDNELIDNILNKIL